MSLALATEKNSNGFVSGQGPCNRLARGAPSTLCYPSTITLLFDSKQSLRAERGFWYHTRVSSWQTAAKWLMINLCDRFIVIQKVFLNTDSPELLHFYCACKIASLFTKRERDHTDKIQLCYLQTKETCGEKGGEKNALKICFRSTMKVLF